MSTLVMAEYEYEYWHILYDITVTLYSNNNVF